MAEKVTLDDLVLSRIQTGFPLSSRPYDALARLFDVSPEAVQAATANLRDRGIVRRIGATFDPSHLGYVSTLAALAAPEDRIEAIADMVNGYDEVTHNYQRDDRHSLWFTVIAPSRQRIGEVLSAIESQAACGSVLDLPATRLFKIRVDFPVAGMDVGEFEPRTIVPANVSPARFTDAERALVRALQGDIGIGATPFADLGETVGMTEDEVLETMGRWRDEGIVRRLGAVVRHRTMGMTANAMTVWDVPDRNAVDAGEAMAAFTEVSHCYERVRSEDWPHNLYAMIHGTTPEACHQTATRIHAALASRGIAVPDPRLLFSTREFKKTSMRYFTEDATHTAPEGASHATRQAERS